MSKGKEKVKLGSVQLQILLSTKYTEMNKIVHLGNQWSGEPKHKHIIFYQPGLLAASNWNQL